VFWFVYELGHPLSGSYYLFFLAGKKKEEVTPPHASSLGV